MLNSRPFTQMSPSAPTRSDKKDRPTPLRMVWDRGSTKKFSKLHIHLQWYEAEYVFDYSEP